MLTAASKVTATHETGNDEGQASFSFGELVSSGMTRSFTITVTSVSTSTVTYSISVVPASAGPSITPAVTSLAISGGATGSGTKSLSLSTTLAGGDYFGDIQLARGT